MSRTRFAIHLATLALLVASGLAAAAGRNAEPIKILSRSVYELPAFDQLPKADFFAVTRGMYEKITNAGRGKLQRITYSSQGLRVVALVLPPAGTATARAPVIVFCRGGAGPGGAIGLTNALPLYE